MIFFHHLIFRINNGHVYICYLICFVKIFCPSIFFSCNAKKSSLTYRYLAYHFIECDQFLDLSYNYWKSGYCGGYRHFLAKMSADLLTLWHEIQTFFFVWVINTNYLDKFCGGSPSMFHSVVITGCRNACPVGRQSVIFQSPGNYIWISYFQLHSSAKKCLSRFLLGSILWVSSWSQQNSEKLLKLFTSCLDPYKWLLSSFRVVQIIRLFMYSPSRYIFTPLSCEL